MILVNLSIVIKITVDKTNKGFVLFRLG